MAQGYCDKCGKFIKRKRSGGLCRECHLSPENSKRRSEQVKKALRDPIVRQRKSESIKEAWARGAYDTEEYRKNRSKIAKKKLSDPHLRKRISEGVKAAWKRGDFDAEEIQQKKSEAMKAKWQEIGYRKRLLAARKDPEIRQQISETRKANWQDPEYREQQLASHRDPEYRQSLSERATIRWEDSEQRQQHSKIATVTWQDPEIRQRRIEAMPHGENHPNWQGGISFEPYGPEFNKELRHYIRKRDNHTCTICGKRAKCIHHIDYNKTENSPENLITLCRKCHGKTNVRRHFWRVVLAPVARRREEA